jgi:hypothetical protein
MATLNSGFSIARGSKISDEDRTLIEEYIRTKGIKKISPSSVKGSEISRATRENIVIAKREFYKIYKKSK